MRTEAEIIVPAFNGHDALQACLESLARTVPAGTCIQLVDDASPDARIVGLLESFATRRAAGEVRLHRNARNLGFVATVNQAMDRTRRDVILLNADTVTTVGWYEGLLRCLAADARVATATPFSNCAEICSLPLFCRDNPLPDDPERWALACRQAGPPEYPVLPTAVGFCMAIRRAALDQVGLFDADTFGRGYGEENDFCMRAAGHGWRHVLCDDVFVAHRGGVSFAPTGLRPGGINQRRLEARYPAYARLVSEFIASDPLGARRARIVARWEAA